MGFLFGITIPTSLYISRIYYLFVHFFHALAPCYLSGSGPMLISVFVAMRSQDSLLYNYDWDEPDRAHTSGTALQDACVCLHRMPIYKFKIERKDTSNLHTC